MFSTTTYHRTDYVNRKTPIQRLNVNDTRDHQSTDFVYIPSDLSGIRHRNHPSQASKEGRKGRGLIFDPVGRSRSFLLQTPDEIAEDEYILTGPRRFEDYGIPLLATDTRHWRCLDAKVRIAEQIFEGHIRVIGKNVAQLSKWSDVDPDVEP
jgi:hypothetical protein